MDHDDASFVPALLAFLLSRPPAEALSLENPPLSRLSICTPLFLNFISYVKTSHFNSKKGDLPNRLRLSGLKTG